jgi:hypothetical protein
LSRGCSCAAGGVGGDAEEVGDFVPVVVVLAGLLDGGGEGGVDLVGEAGEGVEAGAGVVGAWQTAQVGERLDGLVDDGG